MNIIEIKNVTKSYNNSFKAIDDISLEIKSSKIYGLLGSNGAGKTTLIRMLIGSLKPSKGKISVDGLDPIKDKDELRRKIGYMPQKGSLYEDMSAVQNLNFFGQAHDIENLDERVTELLKFFEIYDHKDQLVSKYSGGMKRKLSLACAIIHKPKLLFLDEPTAAIDPLLKESIWKHFEELKKQGTTIIVSSHAMEEAVKCDKLCILRQGKVIYNDSPENIFANSKVEITYSKNNKEHKVSTSMGKDLTKNLKKLGLDKNIQDLNLKIESLENIIIDFINK